MSFLETQADVPFFLYLSHWSVHGPYQAPEAMVARYRAKGLEGKKAVYAAMVESVDRSVGGMMEKLDQLGLAERTVLVFMSDNGGTGVTSMAPLRGIKATLYEGGIRVPLIVRWPGHVPSAQHVHRSGHQPRPLSDLSSTGRPATAARTTLRRGQPGWPSRRRRSAQA